MSARVYVLLDIEHTRIGEAAETLRNMRGVRMVDVLEGPPNLLMLVQARNRQRLAEITNQALASVESMTQDVQLLPAQNGYGKNESKQHRLPVRR